MKSTTNMKCNKVHVITDFKDKNIVKNLQENISIFNQIRQI